MTTNHRKVVARYADGRLVKGYTFDFAPANPRFHVFSHPAATGPSTQVLVRELKAVFFVRDLVGNPARQDSQKFPPGQVSNPHVEVRFRDGEVMLGTADSPATESHGFFLIPRIPSRTTFACTWSPRRRESSTRSRRRHAPRRRQRKRAPTGLRPAAPARRSSRAAFSAGSRGRLGRRPARPTPVDGGHACTRSML
jgi:hypothetical protein